MENYIFFVSSGICKCLTMNMIENLKKIINKLIFNSNIKYQSNKYQIVNGMNKKKDK